VVYYKQQQWPERRPAVVMRPSLPRMSEGISETAMLATTTMTQPTTAAPAVAPTTWQIDPSHSTAEFAVRHMMVSTVKGHVSSVEGTISLDETDLAHSSVTVSLDATSIDTREPKRDVHLRSADFLDVEQFPKITFSSTRIEHDRDGYRIVGDLTVRDVTREMGLMAAFEGQQRDPWGGERAGFTAQGAIDRRDFGLTWNQPLPGAGIMLGNDVRISIELEAVLKT
jgi:polyisoprenoid-binding protein YceI